MASLDSINSGNYHNDVKILLDELLDQIHQINSLSENISIKIEPRHHDLPKKVKTRSTTSKHRKRRIFSSSEDDSSSSSDDSLLSQDHKTLINEDSDDDDEQKALHNHHGPRTRNELAVDDLPPIENLTITLSEETPVELIGHVRHIVEGKLLIIESLLHSPPLNDDSVLFNRDRRSIGLIFETFGPVEKPYYSIRYNDINSINQRQIELNQEVFYAPKETTYTKYVFVQELKALKGSDASWEDDNEPPNFAIDYSDDEEERAAKASQRGKRNRDETSDEPIMGAINNDINNVTSNYSNFGRGRGRGRQREFRRGAGAGAGNPSFNNNNRPPPSIPNWFQNTSNSTSFQQQQQSPWQNNVSSFSSASHFSTNDPNTQRQQQQQQPPPPQVFQNSTSTHSAFPWM